jgi:ABC-type multidrug transport system fused ATPase/permease subunit
MTFIRKFLILFNFLDLKEKTKFFIIVAILFLQSLLEALSVGLVIPVLSLVLKKDNMEDYLWVLPYYVDKNNYIIVILALILIFFILKNFYIYFATLLSYKFAFSLQKKIKEFIYLNYINLDYEDYLEEKSSVFISSITTQVSLLTINFVIPCLMIISEGLILISMLFVLILFEIKSFIIISTLIIISIFFGYKILAKTLRNIGKNKEELESEGIQIVQNSIGLLKVTKLYNLEESFFSHLKKINRNLASIQSKFYTFQNIPRSILELIIFLAISILILFLILFNYQDKEILLITGLFAAAGFKIIPSVNRIILNMQSLKYSSTSVNIINEIFLKFKRREYIKKNICEEIIDFNNKIELKNCYFYYKKNINNLILDNLSFNLQKSEKIGIFGSSGTGKTTFLDILLGILPLTSGKIFVDGKEANLNSLHWKKIISYVPQSNFLINGTLKSNIALGQLDNDIDCKFVKELISLVSLDLEFQFRDDFPENLAIGEKGINLSGGQIQRIGIARALYKKPKILIMDEPTSALDSYNEKKIMDSITSIKDLTLIIVSHKETSLESCHKIYKFEHGKLILKKN